jgi:hypothetical protein
MQARRLRLNRHHRQLSTRCTGNPEQTISDGHDRSVFRGLSQPDSSLETLAAIPALANEQCNFRGSRSAAALKPKLSGVKKICGSVVLVFSSGHRIYSCCHPVIHCSSFHFPAFAAAAVINTPSTFRDIPTFLNTILLPG